MKTPIEIQAEKWKLANPDAIYSFLGVQRLLGSRSWRLAREGSGPADLQVTHGNEAFFAYAAKPLPLPTGQKRGIFCGDGSPGEAELIRALEAKHGDILVLASHPDQLNGVATPGPKTLFTPRWPELHARALASAQFVVSKRLLPALTAGGAGVPVLFLGAGGEAEVARQWNLPVAEARPETVLGALEIALAAGKAGEPEVYRRNCAELEKKIASPGENGTPKGGGGTRVFASISNVTYFPFLEGFAANLADVYRGDKIHLYVLALDEATVALAERYLRSLDRITLVRLADLWKPDQLPEIHRRTIGVQAFSSKPLLIRRAVAETGGTVFYADSDVHFFERPEILFGAVATKGILLFPHWNDEFECARKDGLFNAGMMVANPAGRDFLDWWSERCWQNANFGRNDGVVADQGYLDFGPALFDSVKAYRHGDHDVARWNLYSLGVHWDEAYPPRARLLNGEPVASYHTAFVDSLGLFEAKCGWDALIHFFSGTFSAAEIPAPVFELSLQQQAKHWLTLSRWLSLGEKLKLAKVKKPAWTKWAVSGWGPSLLAALAAGRKVPWNPGPPRLPPTTDPWILANREQFLLQQTEIPVKRLA